MKNFIATVILTTAAFTAPAAAGGFHLEPNVGMSCQISPDASKSFFDRMFTSCGWNAGVTLKKTEKNNYYSYEGDTYNNNSKTITRNKTVNKKTVIRKKKIIKKRTTINDNSFRPTINNPSTVNIY